MLNYYRSSHLPLPATPDTSREMFAQLEVRDQSFEDWSIAEEATYEFELSDATSFADNPHSVRIASAIILTPEDTVKVEAEKGFLSWISTPMPSPITVTLTTGDVTITQGDTVGFKHDTEQYSPVLDIRFHQGHYELLIEALPYESDDEYADPAPMWLTATAIFEVIPA
jgi:hypothetical protein